MKIPKIIIQSSPEKQPPYVLEILSKFTRDWQYRHFTDEECVEYFIKYPEPKFPFLVNKFNNMPFGAHKADLFRYYFLYQNGGVFLDSDAMIERNLDDIVLEYDVFSVKSYIKNTIFQGFIGAIPRHPILYLALKDAYEINIETLKLDYHVLTRNLYYLFTENENQKLYKELESDGDKAVTIDGNCSLILTHYWKTKTIPLK